MAPGSHASGNCQEHLLGYAKAHARSPHSASTTPIIVLFDSSVNHTSCSAMLARNLRLPLSSCATDTGGSPSTLPFITTQITVLLDGTTGPGVTIPVTLAMMSVRTVPTVLVPEARMRRRFGSCHTSLLDANRNTSFLRSFPITHRRREIDPLPPQAQHSQQCNRCLA
ncbi:hypothetical protein AAVH_10797 [Aphelenchoides avenae]|nr:hypothetical protein AAVH_10797 [Aphelenchus avenae]